MNILKNFKKKNYNSNPFPFFTINNAFTEKEYSILLSDYKLIISLLKLNKNYSENNIRLQISSEDFLNNNLLKKTSWYDFILFHNSKEFILNLFDIFYEDIIKFYPNLVKAINKKDNQNFNGIRTKNNLNKYELKTKFENYKKTANALQILPEELWCIIKSYNKYTDIYYYHFLDMYLY